MSISIHYKGRIKQLELLPELINEVKDIVEIHQWDYTILKAEFPAELDLNRQWDDSLYGIVIFPPESEAVQLSFLFTGELCSLWAMKFYREDKNHESLTQGISVKTQYAGPHIHQLVIHLLDYLSKKYFSRFTLTDESQYWETRNEKLLIKHFADLKDSFEKQLEEEDLLPEESFEMYILRITKKLQKRKPRDI